MDNDLISRSRLIDALNNRGIKFDAEINKIILDQPTAYDVDKVVEEIEICNIGIGRDCRHKCEQYDWSVGACQGMCEDYVKKCAIEIVRGAR